MPKELDSICEICKHSIYIRGDFIGCSLDETETDAVEEPIEGKACDSFERDYSVKV